MIPFHFKCSQIFNFITNPIANVWNILPRKFVEPGAINEIILIILKLNFIIDQKPKSKLKRKKINSEAMVLICFDHFEHQKLIINFKLPKLDYFFQISK
ncbi:hypothetical protein BpHYR1_034108 [Brachionus plicatilis]|uniref:Uncharacterized protein n=1 Tax=Brachionus plicatilis TaxID=10195 RepID=A0A3M7PK00_BRAPC|nr:hypothetical protein BpHYR1_034108 [Brachionus plicatilis]